MTNSNLANYIIGSGIHMASNWKCCTWVWPYCLRLEKYAALHSIGSKEMYLSPHC